MTFGSEKDVLAWYEGQPRVLDKTFLDGIPWNEVKDHPVDPSFIPVLVYMRDIEKMTSVYHRELSWTPTWRDPSVRHFMDRWSAEEPLHGDLLNRFLEEAGYPTDDRWFDEVRGRMGLRYAMNARLQAATAQLFGRHFSGVHMTIGAINELTTLTGYQRLWTLARHPVLERVLRGIVREEARHYFFYWSVARLKLLRSDFARKLNRLIVEAFWVPVGQGIKTPTETDGMCGALFGDEEGLALLDRQVTQRAAQLPGLEGFSIVTERITNAAMRSAIARS